MQEEFVLVESPTNLVRFDVDGLNFLGKENYKGISFWAI